MPAATAAFSDSVPEEAYDGIVSWEGMDRSNSEEIPFDSLPMTINAAGGSST